MKLKISEKQIETSILNWLELKRFYPIKVENVGIYDQKRGIYRKSKSPYQRSISDIIFFYEGQAIFVEVKTPEIHKYIEKHWDRLVNYEVESKKSLSDQVNFILELRQRNINAFFASSIECVASELELLS